MTLNGPRILVVGDVDSFESVARILRPAGAEVVWAHSGREALAALGAAAMDVVLVDLTRDGGGFAFMRALRALPAARGGRLPALSFDHAFLDEDRLQDWRDAGFQLHLLTPLDEDGLLAAVEVLAGRDVERRRGDQAWPAEPTVDRRGLARA